MKILFANHEDPIALQWERPEMLRREKDFRLFEQLIMNQKFLPLIIRILEVIDIFFFA